MDALDAFEVVLGPDQNIAAEGLDDDVVEMSEDDEDEEDEEDMDDEYDSAEGEEEDEEDEDEDMEDENADENDDENDTSINVTLPMLKEWIVAANKKSPAAWKKMLLAFRSIVRSDEPGKTQFTYRVESSKGK